MTEVASGRSRRAWLGAAAGVALAAGAAGLVWRRGQQQSQVLSEVENAFWQLKFARVDGSELAVSDFKGRPLILNFWATWCPPCVEELPLLSAFLAKTRSVAGRFWGWRWTNALLSRGFWPNPPCRSRWRWPGLQALT